jgi:hypothetical protein
MVFDANEKFLRIDNANIYLLIKQSAKIALLNFSFLAKMNQLLNIIM